MALSLSKQCFKNLLRYATFPIKTLFPPGYCLCVCDSLLSAFIYLALQSLNHLSTCTFVCVCPFSLCWCVEWDVSFLLHGNVVFPLLKELGRNLAWLSLCVSLLLWFSSLSLPCDSKKIKINSGNGHVKMVCPLVYFICNFCILNFPEICQRIWDRTIWNI